MALKPVLTQNRLRELSERLGTPAYLLDDPEMLQADWFKPGEIIGVTAGASAPESLVQAVIAKLKQWGVRDVVELDGCKEHIVFALPKELRSLYVELDD